MGLFRSKDKKTDVGKKELTLEGLDRQFSLMLSEVVKQNDVLKVKVLDLEKRYADMASIIIKNAGQGTETVVIDGKEHVVSKDVAAQMKAIITPK